MTFDNAGGTSASTFTLEGGGSRTKLDFTDAGNLTINVPDKTQRDETHVPEILLNGTDADTILNVSRGDIGCAFYAGEGLVIDKLNMSYVSDQQADAVVELTDGVTLSSCDIEKFGGRLIFASALATIEQNAGETTVNGSGAITGVQKIRGGIYRVDTTGTISGVITVSDAGIVTFNGDPQAKTVSNPIEKYGSQSQIIDNFKVVASLVIDNNEASSLRGIEGGTDARWTRAATA